MTDERIIRVKNCAECPYSKGDYPGPYRCGITGQTIGEIDKIHPSCSLEEAD